MPPDPIAAPLCIAVIGTSHIHVVDYLDVISALPWVQLVGVAQIDPDTRNALPADLPDVVARGDLPPHDLLVVMTDIASHDAVCTNPSAPVLFVEKPLAVDVARAIRLARSLTASGTRVETGFFLRHSDALAALVAATGDDRMGRIRAASLSLAHPGLRDGWLRAWPAHLGADRMGGGAFADMAIHLVDVAHAMLGPLRAVSCQLDPYRGSDGAFGAGFDVQGQATLAGGEGALLHVWVSAVAPRVVLSAHVVCDGGEVVLEGGRVVVHRGGQDDQVLLDGPMPTPADGFRAALHALRDGRAPVTRLADAVEASRVMSALREMGNR